MEQALDIIEEINHLKSNMDISDQLFHSIDKRLAITENNYSGITLRLDRLDTKIDDLKDVVIEKKVQKEIRDRIKTFIYNGGMLVLGVIGIYDILFKFFGL